MGQKGRRTKNITIGSNRGQLYPRGNHIAAKGGDSWTEVGPRDHRTK